MKFGEIVRNSGVHPSDSVKVSRGNRTRERARFWEKGPRSVSPPPGDDIFFGTICIIKAWVRRMPNILIFAEIF